MEPRRTAGQQCDAQRQVIAKQRKSGTWVYLTRRWGWSEHLDLAKPFPPAEATHAAIEAEGATGATTSIFEVEVSETGTPVRLVDHPL